MAGSAHLDLRARAQALLAAALSGGEGGGAAAGTATLTVLSARRLGSLWAGYGSITECETDDEEAQSLIIKVSHDRQLSAQPQHAAAATPPASVCLPDWLALCLLPASRRCTRPR